MSVTINQLKGGNNPGEVNVTNFAVVAPNITRLGLVTCVGEQGSQADSSVSVCYFATFFRVR